MWTSEEQLLILYKSIPSCQNVPRHCDKKTCSNKFLSKSKQCRRARDGKVFALPRLYSKEVCNTMKKKGFTQRASCAAYE